MAIIEDFEKLDIRVGRIIEVEDLPDPKYSTHKLVIDFGAEFGVKKSCARVNKYSHERNGLSEVAQFVWWYNFSPPKRTSNFRKMKVNKWLILVI